jgi:predicted MFS family arabinose efflux permease
VSDPALGSPRAVGVAFTLAGVVSTAAFSRVPSLRDETGATPAQLSLALVCVGLGALSLMPFTGRLTQRFSSAVVVRAFGVISLTGWVLAAYAPSVLTLAVALYVTGIGAGVWDVAMNVQGHTVEQRRQRVLMPAWHALFSYGAVVGAVLGAIAARSGLSVQVQFPIVSVAAAVAVFWCTRQFVDDHDPHASVPAADLAPSALQPVDDTTPPRGITVTEVLIGLMVLGTALGEGAANDWLGLTLVDTRGLPEAFGAVALAGFNITMATARLVGGRLIARRGRVPVLQVSGATASVGVLLLCLVDSPVTAVVGAALWGLGLAVVFPSGISAAGELPGRGARGISVVSTIGHTGFLVGAPLIGQLSRVVSLDRALLVVAVAAALVAVLAPAARERSAPGRAAREQG